VAHVVVGVVKVEAGLVDVDGARRCNTKFPSGGGLMCHIARMTGQPSVACDSIFMRFNLRYVL